MVIKMLTAPPGSKLANMVQCGAGKLSIVRSAAVSKVVDQTLVARRDRLKVAAHVPGLSQLLSAAVFHVN